MTQNDDVPEYDWPLISSKRSDRIGVSGRFSLAFGGCLTSAEVANVDPCRPRAACARRRALRNLPNRCRMGTRAAVPSLIVGTRVKQWCCPAWVSRFSSGSAHRPPQDGVLKGGAGPISLTRPRHPWVPGAGTASSSPHPRPHGDTTPRRTRISSRRLVLLRRGDASERLERGSVGPHAVQDHSQATRERHTRLLQATALRDCHGPTAEG